MRVGICEWTTFPASFEEELAAYRAAGAGAIGILELKLDGVDDVRGKLRESGLAVSSCLPAAGSILPSPLIPGPEEPEARVESICASVARFAELEASCVFFLTGPGRRPRGRGGDPPDRRGGRAARRRRRAGADPPVAGGGAFAGLDDRAGARADRRRGRRGPLRHVAPARGLARRPDPRRARVRPDTAGDAVGPGPRAARRRLARGGARARGRRLRGLVRRRGDVRRRHLRRRVPRLAVGAARGRDRAPRGREHGAL